MSVFGAYSRYYNLLYKDKDYSGEAEYVAGLIRKHRPGSKSLLDLGCGTGRHDLLLAGMGYEVTGVDLSEEMLAVARAQQVSFNSQLSTLNGSCSTFDNSRSSLNFVHGDIRTIRLERTFDVVISLFHVMSYQVTNADLQAVFATAWALLEPGGIFIFDCWYGPAVITDRPAVRVKRLEDEAITVTRIAEPVMHPNENLVDVNYHILIRDKATGEVEELRETHTMRYLFAPEIKLLCNVSGLRMEQFYEFMGDQSPGFDTWTAIFIATKDES
jgi:SAM-dependent methyltransferase